MTLRDDNMPQTRGTAPVLCGPGRPSFLLPPRNEGMERQEAQLCFAALGDAARALRSARSASRRSIGGISETGHLRPAAPAGGLRGHCGRKPHLRSATKNASRWRPSANGLLWNIFLEWKKSIANKKGEPRGSPFLSGYGFRYAVTDIRG